MWGWRKPFLLFRSQEKDFAKKKYGSLCWNEFIMILFIHIITAVKFLLINGWNLIVYFLKLIAHFKGQIQGQ